VEGCREDPGAVSTAVLGDRRCTFAYEISPARKAGDEREYQFIEYRNGYKNGIIMLFMI